MLDDRLELVKALIDPRLLRPERFHLRVELRHLAAHRLRQLRNPRAQQLLLARRIVRRLVKGRDVPGEALAEVVDQAHAQHLIHIQLREFVPQQKRHQRDAPAVLRDTLVPSAGRVAVARHVLEPLRRVQNLQQLHRFHSNTPCHL